MDIIFFFQEEKMEMTGPAGNAPPPSYGTDAGYSEDYGSAAKPKIYPTLDNTEYSNTGVYGSSTNGSAANQSGGDAAPVNPFTQQQYQGTNPFTKK